MHTRSLDGPSVFSSMTSGEILLTNNYFTQMCVRGYVSVYARSPRKENRDNFFLFIIKLSLLENRMVEEKKKERSEVLNFGNRERV